MYQGDTINVFVTDDHEAVRFALESWIKTKAGDEAPYINLAGTAPTGAETVTALKTLKPDVLLIDMQLSDTTGLEVIKSLRQKGNTSEKLSILAMTGNENVSVHDILASGANGYLSKAESGDTFIAAIRWIAQHPSELWLSSSVAQQLVVIDHALNSAGITPVERNVLRLIRLPNKEIAELLSISEGTVKNYISSIYQKLNVGSRLEATKFAARIGLIPSAQR
ncbi:MAG: response regulator transcription factor [Ignavibacteria bacterium]|nr:response regulator transcription factor [Ignavibacteria bacterium]